MTITHPFHPFCGQTFPLLKIRRANGVRLYSLDIPEGVQCVPETWTDRRPPTGLPSTPWSPAVVRELQQLFIIIMQSDTSKD